MDFGFLLSKAIINPQLLSAIRNFQVLESKLDDRENSDWSDEFYVRGPSKGLQLTVVADAICWFGKVMERYVHNQI